MKKKMLCATLAALLAASLPAGCAGPGAAASQGDGSQPAFYTLEWYYIGPGEVPGQRQVQDAVNAYIQGPLNAAVAMHCIDWGSFQPKVDQMIAAQEPFDICYSADWQGYVNNAAKGGYMEMDALMPQYAPKAMALFEPAYLDTARVAGKLYALPVNTDKAYSHGVLYRKDLADKHSIDFSAVDTYDDLLPILELIKEKEPDIIPVSTSGEKFPNDPAVAALNGGFVEYVKQDDPKDNRVYNLLDSPGFLERCQFMRKLNQGGYMRADALTYQDFDADDNGGKTFLCLAKLKPGVENEITAAATASGVEWAQKAFSKPLYGSATASMMSISRTSKDPARAMMFLEVLNTDPYLADLVNYGIEGEHYTRIDDTFIEPVPNSGYGDWVGLQWVFCNQYILSLLPGEDPDKWEKMDAFNAQATPLRGAGFTFDPTPVKTQAAAVNNIMKSTLDAIKLGVVAPEPEIAALREKLNAAGEEAIMVEMQRQWDEYVRLNSD